MSDLLPKEREGFSLWLSAETRKQLILRLKDIVKQLMPYVHRKELQYLTETHIEVQRLCEVLELILFHGLKISEFQGQVVFWGLLERLEVITPPCIPLRNSVGAIACIGTLRTPLGKARGWIRQSLNSQSLEESVQFMLSQTHNWVSKFYYPDALLCQKEEGSMLVAVIRSLKIFCFNLTIDNDALNSPSPSLTRLIQVQTALSPTSTASPSSMKSPSGRGSAPGSVRTPNTSSNAGGGVGSFDSIMKSFETGLDKILNHVDQLLNSSLDSPDQQSLDTPSASSSHSSKKLTSLFGSSLRDLVLDDQRCAHANLNAELGIPTMIIKLIQYIHHNAQTPNLFRQRVTVTAIEELKRSLEAEKGIPATCNIATVSFVLIQWLNQLPEPLLGFDHYAAILACAEVEDIRHRTRNLSLLLAETSWYNKPLLLMTLSLLAHCLLPENTSHNQLNHIAVAVLCTPFLLRPPYDKPVAYLSQEEIDRLQMAATAAGSHLIEFLVQHQTEVCEVVREELNMKQVILSHKCNRVRQLQETLALSFDISDVGSFDADRLQLLYHLWHLLAPVEKSLSFNHTSSSGATTPPPHSIGEGEGVVTSVPLMSMEEILAHPRWVVCGLLLTSDKSSSLPLTEFNSPLGLLAIQCFVAFLKKYDVRAVNILVDFQLNRQGFCRLAQVILRLTHFTADVLYLLPPSSSVTSSSSSGIRSIAPIQYISKTLAWQLLGDDAAFQDLFDISLLCFDEAWRNVTERIGELASTETLSQALFRTRAMLWDIMVKKPTTTSQVWETWTNLKLAEEEKLFQRMLLTSSNSKTVHHHATTTSTPSNTASPMASSGHSYILNHGKVKTLTSPSNAATSNTSNKPPSLPPPPQTTNSSQRNARKGSDVTNSSDEDDDDFNDFDNPDDNLPLNQRQRQSNNTASSTPSSTSSYTSVAASTLSSLFSSFQPLSSSQTQSNQNRGNFGRALDTSSSDDDDDDNDVITAKGSKTAPIPTTNNNNNNSNSNNSNNNTTNKIFTIEEGEGFLNIHQNDNNNNNLNTSTSSNTTKGGVRGSLRDVEVNDSTVVGRGGVVIGGGSVEVVPSLNTMSMAMRHYEQTGEMNEYMNSALTAEMMRREVVSVTQKTSMGITTNIFGGSKILSMSQILQLEAVLPATHQCYDWKLLYRLSLHGASLATLLHKAQGHSNTLLVVQDSRGAIFGALVTDSMKVAERDKYYGNGTMGVWSFNNPNGALRYYNWSFKNSYFMITSKECIAFGGGGHFALYLDSDLNHGSSGPCQTFSSPCLASEEEFHCTSCELFSFQATTGSSATSTTNNTSSTSSH